jgi:phosphoenolpyruvate-protein kinase (PTS system EI component)
MTCQASLAAGIPVSICGEIAGDAEAVPLLLGLGLQELSAPAPAIPLVKEAVRRSQQAACRALAEQALRCEDAAAVRALVHGGTRETVRQEDRKTVGQEDSKTIGQEDSKTVKQ